MDNTTLPVQMIEPKRRRIRDMRRGESAYVIFTSLKANDRGVCFLDTADWLTDKDNNFQTLQVCRDEKGFHVVVPADVEVMRMPTSYRFAFWFSFARVASVTVGPSRRVATVTTAHNP
jgi:hypothetical protein